MNSGIQIDGLQQIAVQYCQEFITRPPEDRAGRADLLFQRFRHAPKDLVTNQVSAGVVDGFEPIDVEHHDAPDLPGPNFVLHQRIPGASIPEAGEAVRVRQRFRRCHCRKKIGHSRFAVAQNLIDGRFENLNLPHDSGANHVHIHGQKKGIHTR